MINCLQARLLKIENDQKCTPMKSANTAPTQTSKNISKNVTTHQVIVSLAEDENLTKVSFADKVKSNLRSVPVTSIKVTKNNKGIINFPNPKARQEGLTKLVDDFTAEANDRPQRIILPKITIHNINSNDYTSEDTEKLKEAICEKNPTLNTLIKQGKFFKVLFINKDPRKPDSSYAAVKVDKQVYEAIKSLHFQIYVDFSRCHVSNRLRLTQCYRCQKFGHTDIDCPLKPKETFVCRYCSGNHDGRSCQLKSHQDKLKCANCSAKHSSTYKKCPVLQNQLDFLILRTQGLEYMTKKDVLPHTIIT